MIILCRWIIHVFSIYSHSLTHTHTYRVSLESSSDSDDDADSADRALRTSGFHFDDFHPLPRFGNDSLRSNRRGNEAGGSRRKNTKAKTTAMSKVL